MLLEEGYRARFQAISLKLVEEALVESLTCMEMEIGQNDSKYQFLRRRSYVLQATSKSSLLFHRILQRNRCACSKIEI